MWRHQTGRIFSSGYGPIRLWTRAAPPPIRFARRRLREICRSPSFEHVVPSACVLKRRIRDVIAPLPTGGVRKQKRHNSKNPTSRLVGFSVLEKSYQFSRNPTSFSTGRIFRLEKSSSFSTGRIFSPGCGPNRLRTRAAPPPLRFARRRMREICRSRSSKHVVTSAFVVKRRIRDVIATLP